MTATTPPTEATTARRNSWRGGCPRLGARLLRTYATVVGLLLVGFLLSLPVAAVVSEQGEGLEGLGYAIVAIGVGLLLGLAAGAVASWFLRLGWGTVVGLLAMPVAVLALGVLTTSGIVAALAALVWPAAIALVVHGRWVVGAGAAVLVVLLGASVQFGLEHQQTDRRQAAVAQELRGSGVTLYAPPEAAGTQWEFVMVHQDGTVQYEFTREAIEYEVALDDAPDPGEPAVSEGEVTTADNGKAVLTRRGDTWITVRAFGEGNPGERAADVPAAQTLARDLVEVSPEVLAERDR